MGGLLFGYDWVVIGGAKIFYEQYFGLENLPALRGWAMSSALVGCILSALVSGKLSDMFGRKKMLVAASVLFVVSAVGTGATDSFSYFVFYRIIGGVGIGIASNISPIYIAEVSPADVRGRFVSLNQLTIVIGILAAQICNMLIGNHYSESADILAADGIEWAWRYMFWAELIPACLFLILVFFIPESPRWLLVNGRLKDAESVFSRIGGQKYASDIVAALSEFATEENRSSFRLVFQPRMRAVIIIGIVLAVFQQWCGLNVVFNYAHEIFSAAGYSVSDVFMNIVVTGVTNLLFTFVAIFTVDRIGRRSLMLIGAGGLSVIYFVLGLCYHLELHGLPLLILVILAIACYAMTLAPVVWVVLSEIFPNRIRGMAMAVSTFFLWLASFLLTYTFPVLNDWLGTSGTFWIYDLICVAGFIFVLRRLPETKGKTLEAIEKELVNQNRYEK